MMQSGWTWSSGTHREFHNGESLQKFTVDDLLRVGPNILENLYQDSFDPGLF